MGSDARHAFASATLEVLLQELQPYPSAFQLAAVEPADACITVQRGTRSPEGVPDALRREAGEEQGGALRRVLHPSSSGCP